MMTHTLLLAVSRTDTLSSVEGSTTSPLVYASYGFLTLIAAGVALLAWRLGRREGGGWAPRVGVKLSLACGVLALACGFLGAFAVTEMDRSRLRSIALESKIATMRELTSADLQIAHSLTAVERWLRAYEPDALASYEGHVAEARASLETAKLTALPERAGRIDELIVAVSSLEETVDRAVELTRERKSIVSDELTPSSRTAVGLFTTLSDSLAADGDTQLLNLVSQAERAFKDAETEKWRYFASKAGSLDVCTGSLNDAIARLGDERLSKSSTAELHALLNEYCVAIGRLGTVSEKRDIVTERDVSAAATAVSALADEIALGIKDAVFEDGEAAISAAELTEVKMLAISISSVVLCVGFTFITVRSMLRRLAGVSRAMKLVAGGDLRVSELSKNGTDEFADLARSCEEMVNALSELVHEASGAAADVADASTEIAASSHEMVQGMTDQGEQITQISAAAEQLSNSAVEVAEQSQVAAELSATSVEKARGGGVIAEHTAETMRRITEVVDRTGARIRSLGERGEQIGEVVRLIDDIADQTNLLALNAAIEAARAGDHGRGFAVVADEVRKLADRTSQATLEISSSISEIRTETEEAVERMAESTAEIAQGLEQTEKSRESLGAIVDSAEQAGERIGSIAAASDQQSGAARQIASNLTQIHSIADRVQAGAQENASAISRLATRATSLETIIARFRQSSNDVQEIRGGWRSESDCRFLVVDDDTSFVRAFEAMLSPHGRVSTAQDAHGAVSAFSLALHEQELFDAVFVDLRMPGTSGIELVERLRSDEDAAGVPSAGASKIFVVTSSEDPADALSAFGKRVDGYINKPIDVDQVARVLATIGLQVA